MHWILAILIMVILGLQIRLWFSEGSYEELHQLKQKIEQQKATNQQLAQENKKLIQAIKALKEDDEAIIERAREELGMVGKNETFYQLIPSTLTETP